MGKIYIYVYNRLFKYYPFFNTNNVFFHTATTSGKMFFLTIDNFVFTGFPAARFAASGNINKKTEIFEEILHSLCFSLLFFIYFPDDFLLPCFLSFFGFQFFKLVCDFANVTNWTGWYKMDWVGVWANRTCPRYQKTNNKKVFLI